MDETAGLYGRALTVFERARDAPRPGVVTEAELDALVADQRHRFNLATEQHSARQLEQLEAQIAEIEQRLAGARDARDAWAEALAELRATRRGEGRGG